MSIVIREVTMADLESVVQIEAAAFKMSVEFTQKDMVGRIENYPDTFLVAEDNGKVVGHVFGPAFDKRYIEDHVYFENHPNRVEDQYQLILSLAVVPEYQKRGIATKLLEGISMVAKKEGRKALSLTCLTKLIPFYEKRGFINEGETSDDIPDPENEVSYNMIKKL